MSDKQRDRGKPSKRIKHWRSWMSDNQSAAYIPLRFAGMTVANDSPLECLHVPRRDSDLQAGPECYQMVVSEHQRRLQHMLNWQFEPLLCCLCSKSLTCNVHSGPGAHKNHSYAAITVKQLWATLAPAVRQRASALCLGWTPLQSRCVNRYQLSTVALSLVAFSWDLAPFQAAAGLCLRCSQRDGGENEGELDGGSC